MELISKNKALDTLSIKFGTNTFLIINSYRLISLAVFFYPIARIIGFFSYLIAGKAIYGQVFCLIVWSILLLLHISHNKSEALLVVGYFLAALMIFAISYILFPLTRDFYNEYTHELECFLIVGIPAFAFLTKINNLCDLIKEFIYEIRFSSILFLISVPFGIFSYVSSMGWGLIVTPIALFSFIYLKLFQKDKNSIVNKILCYLMIFMTLFGGRQWIVIMGVIFAYDFFIKQKFNVIFKGILCILFIIAIYFLYDEIINAMTYIIDKMNIQSRALNSFTQGTLLSNKNRVSIYTYDMNVIRQNGFKISGIFSDRYYLRMYRSSIAYAHNFFYEMLIDFGILFGGIICVIFVFSLIRSYIKCAKEYKFIYFAFICYGFIRYMVSSSVFIECNFLIFLGLLFNKNIRKYKKK